MKMVVNTNGILIVEQKKLPTRKLTAIVQLSDETII